ncbi:hypothetical protein [Piscinibacter sp.]|jgi:hypothetical protein|uniref:hypothetical protein n=1 Tax=Piscinibacter sp. TaxID=1903157 RepID=UPI0035597676
MRPATLYLDFAPAARSPRRLGRVLLLIGGIALAVGVFGWSEAWSARAQYARALSVAQQQEAQAATRSARPVAANAAEVARERATLQAARILQTPWSDLLAALEAASIDNVALLSVEPSTIKQAVRLTAEARDPTAMLVYLTALQLDNRLSQVVLVSHQVQLQSPGMPVRFQIQASWGGTP